MDSLILIALSVGAVVVLIAVLALVLRKKQKNNDEQKETNYLAFFVLGTSFLSLGSIFTILSFTSEFPGVIGFPFLAMGLIYIIIGLANRNTWKTN